MESEKKKKIQTTKLSRGKVLQIICNHLIKQVPHDIEIQDGIPEDRILYGVPKDEPYWTAYVPSEVMMIGPSRINCISEKTGEIIYDGFTSEE